jgi:hypothetical protein
MSADVTRGKRIGDVVQWEVDGGKQGFCRTVVTDVTVEDDIAVGALLNSSGDWIDGSTTAGGNTTYILIDETVYDKANGDHDLVCLHRGPAVVGKDQLSFDGTAIAADYTAAATALEALDIHVVDQVS